MSTIGLILKAAITVALVTVIALATDWQMAARQLQELIAHRYQSPAPVEIDGSAAVVCFGIADVKYGITSLAPLAAGRVAEILVNENDEVEAGAPLLRLDDRMARLKVAESESALETARSQLIEAEQLPQQHQAHLARTKATIEAARRRIEAARHFVAGKQQTQQIRNIGRGRPDPVSAEEVAEAQTKIYELEALLIAEIEQLNDLQLQDPIVKMRRVKSEVTAAEARLEQAQQTLKDCTLRAPQSGMVLRVLVSPGDLVNTTPQPAIQFCPNQPRVIRAEVDQEFAERLQEGQPAEIVDDVNPERTWTGNVERLSNWYTQRRLASDDPATLKDVRTLECIIALAPDQPPVKIGQRVRVLIQ